LQQIITLEKWRGVGNDICRAFFHDRYDTLQLHDGREYGLILFNLIAGGKYRKKCSCIESKKVLNYQEILKRTGGSKWRKDLLSQLF